PVTLDQHHKARLIERHRLGLVVTPSAEDGARVPFGEADLDRLTAAVEALLADRPTFPAVGAIGDGLVDVPTAADVLRKLAT
ncbi:hypothetical protein P6P35_16015, partial [Clostridium perfringens]|nr:hypothetical protein [Clostridium perfringens]